ncbi:hypothetical protein Nepgr_033737 [Nepenthes gracilis]|uniref:Uncharacterized protein n=1 Tax=Nepenthes gracilis TaxID=150966 RepID=A0AAD3TL60_NEPGR|nr:hypothetical protein Nepgr_033737 [Nepenthes gracilis]
MLCSASAGIERCLFCYRFRVATFGHLERHFLPALLALTRQLAAALVKSWSASFCCIFFASLVSLDALIMCSWASVSFVTCMGGKLGSLLIRECHFVSNKAESGSACK